MRDVTDNLQQMAVCRNYEILPEAAKSEGGEADRNPLLVKDI